MKGVERPKTESGATCRWSIYDNGSGTSPTYLRCPSTRSFSQSRLCSEPNKTPEFLPLSRTVPGLMNALETCAHIFKPVEYVNYFKACGYDTD